MLALVALAQAIDPVVLYDLTDDDGGLEPGGDLLQWEWGEVGAGPGSGWNGPNAWSTSLAGAYLNDAVETLTVPLPDLAELDRPCLHLMSWYAFGDGDAGWVEVSDGESWSRLDPVYGYPGDAGWSGASVGWEDVVVDLGALAPDAQLRLVFSADDDGVVGAGWFVDEIGLFDGDVAAPHLGQLAELDDTTDVVGPYTVSVAVEDDSAVASVSLRWSTDAGDSGEAVMADWGDGTWLGAIPGAPPDTVVQYDVVASDGDNSASAPSSPLSFRVYLPAPEDPEGPEDRVLAQSATLRWQPPQTEHAVVGYQVERADGLLTEVAAEDPDGDGWVAGEVPLTGEDDVFVVRARFSIGDDLWLGDPSEEVEVEAAVPALASVSPSSAWAGDHVRLTLRGAYLLFTAGEVEVGLGEGIEVEAVDVQDVDVARVSVVIADDAEPGLRDLSLSTPAGAFLVEDAFTVDDGQARPRLTALSPASIRQGESGLLRVDWAGELGEELVVDLGEGLVVESVSRGEEQLEVEVVCLYTAPLGSHAVSVDDGVRILDGVELEVEDNLRAVNGCGLGLAPRALLALAGLVLLRRR